MHIEVKMNGDPTEALSTRLRELESERQQFVQDIAAEVLKRVIELNPVDSGRSRAAWVQSLEELGGSPPPGWEGPVGDGVAEGRALGGLQRDESGTTSSLRLNSQVDYSRYLEYGTSRSSPYAMVRLSLLSVRGNVAAFWKIASGERLF